MKQMHLHLRRLCAPMAVAALLATTPTLALADAPAPKSPQTAEAQDAGPCKLRLVGRPPYKRGPNMCMETAEEKAEAACKATPASHRGHAAYKRDCGAE